METGFQRRPPVYGPVIFIARALERLAAHATNISVVLFLVEGDPGGATPEDHEWDPAASCMGSPLPWKGVKKPAPCLMPESPSLVILSKQKNLRRSLRMTGSGSSNPQQPNASNTQSGDE